LPWLDFVNKTKRVYAFAYSMCQIRNGSSLATRTAGCQVPLKLSRWPSDDDDDV